MDIALVTMETAGMSKSTLAKIKVQTSLYTNQPRNALDKKSNKYIQGLDYFVLKCHLIFPKIDSLRCMYLVY